MKVWFDCTAAAHPVVLRPVIERFRQRGDEVLVTARENGETVGNLERLGIDHLVVGEHGGAGKFGKAWALASRSTRLARPVWKFRPDLAVAHGSVDLAVLSRSFYIPSAQMQDYEYAGLQRKIAWRVARRVLVPDSIPVDRLEKAGAKESKLVRFPGLKEDYYLFDFEPDPAVPEELGIDLTRGILVIVRPPPETAAYHAENPLYDKVIDRLATVDDVTAVIIPRTEAQRERARAKNSPNLIVPERPVDAQSLIAFADLVVSAGGTMNREAVALGTPVYTTFAGKMGGVDEALIADGRLKLLESADALPLTKRTDPTGPRNPRDPDLLVRGMLEALE
jgi:predicted glycosyltransferase